MFDPTSVHWRLARTGALVVPATLLAGLGHQLGGGGLPHVGAAAAPAVVLGLAWYPATRRATRWPELLGTLLAAQVLFHLMFSLADHAPATVDLWAMAGFHLVAAAATAVVLAVAERAAFRLAAAWRRTVARALAVPAVLAPPSWVAQLPWSTPQPVAVAGGGPLAARRGPPVG
ncbi:hypothetical protein [Nakamurella leprariae]|uniref:Uncharacterized protein n=1 Tax=Nakamurella leprariae TaxID=2803911 RepID=A0A938YJT7_9ACTN|nr:hypothetical protein [Nakamurella leprariae]MBM9469100.1 hypothetical protein [Nakamurella leprariae]